MNSRTLRQIERYQNANKIIFDLRRIPLLGKHINPYLYQNDSLKRKIGVFFSILSLLKWVFIKLIYVFLFITLIPEFLSSTLDFLLLILNEGASFSADPFYFRLSLTLYFVLMLFSAYFTTVSKHDSELKWVLLRSFKIDYKTAYRLFLRRHIIQRFFYALVFASLTFGKSWQLSLNGFALIIASSFFFDALDLFIYSKIDKFVNWKVNTAVFITAILCASALLFLNPQRVMESPFIALGLFVLTLLSYYSLKVFNKYNALSTYTNSRLNLSNDEARRNLELSNEAFRVDDKDINLRKSEEIGERYKGYAYINRLFLMRHKKIWFKPFRIKILIVTGIGLIATTILVIQSIVLPETLERLPKSMVSSIGPFILFIYLLSSGETLTKAYYLNCDYSLLHYAFYRRKETVLKQFNVRLLTIIPLNLLPMLIAAGYFALWSILGFAEYTIPDMVNLTITIILVSIFFSIHSLFLYYILQPFNKDLSVHNVPYSLLSGVIYFFSLYANDILRYVTNVNLWISSLTLVYILTALVLVRLFAEKTFRVKD